MDLRGDVAPPVRDASLVTVLEDGAAMYSISVAGHEQCRPPCGAARWRSGQNLPLSWLLRGALCGCPITFSTGPTAVTPVSIISSPVSLSSSAIAPRLLHHPGRERQPRVTAAGIRRSSGTRITASFFPQFPARGSRRCRAALARAAPDVDAQTCVTRWQGEVCDYDMAVGRCARDPPTPDWPSRSF